MSLINEALQKAQAQDAKRSDAAVPATTAPYQAPPSARRNARRGGLFAALVLGGVIAFMMVGGLGIFGSKELAATPQPAVANSIFVDPHNDTHLTGSITPKVTAEPRDTATPAAAAADTRNTRKEAAAPATAVADAKPVEKDAPAEAPSRPQAIELFADSVYASRPPAVDDDLPPPKAAPKPEAEAKFDPQSAVIPNLGKVKLAAIVRSPNGARAMINSSIVAVGDTIGPAEVIVIEAKRVKLRVDGKTYTLQMP